MTGGNGAQRDLRRTEPFPDARVLLGRYGLQAKKWFGQNFLISDRVFRAIVDATVASDDDWIVEIGAGLGTLTARLAERVPEGKVIALERDPDESRTIWFRRSAIWRSRTSTPPWCSSSWLARD